MSNALFCVTVIDNVHTFDTSKYSCIDQYKFAFRLICKAQSLVVYTYRSSRLKSQFNFNTNYHRKTGVVFVWSCLVCVFMHHHQGQMGGGVSIGSAGVR